MKKICAIILVILPIQLIAQVKVLTLEQTLEYAKLNSPFLHTRAMEVDLSQAAVTTSKLRPNPVLNNQIIQGTQQQYFANGTDALNRLNRQLWWQLSMPINRKNQRQFEIDKAQQTVELSKKNYKETESVFLYEIANRWLEIWHKKQNLAILQKAIGNSDTLISVNQVKLKNQVITKIDLNRTQNLALQQQVQFENLRESYIGKLQNFKNVLGIKDSISLQLDDDLKFIQNAFNEDLVEFAQNTRSDVLVAKQTVSVANSNVILQEVNKKTKPELGVIWNPQNGVGYLGISGTFHLPIFDRNQGEIQKSKIQKNIAEIQLSNIKTLAKNETQVALDKCKKLKLNLNKFEPILSQMNEILNTVKYAYLQGGTTIVDYLEAQRTWLETQQNHQNLLFDYKQSLIELLFISGKINN